MSAVQKVLLPSDMWFLTPELVKEMEEAEDLLLNIAVPPLPSSDPDDLESWSKDLKVIIINYYSSREKVSDEHIDNVFNVIRARELAGLKAKYICRQYGFYLSRHKWNRTWFDFYALIAHTSGSQFPHYELSDVDIYDSIGYVLRACAPELWLKVPLSFGLQMRVCYFNFSTEDLGQVYGMDSNVRTVSCYEVGHQSCNAPLYQGFGRSGSALIAERSVYEVGDGYPVYYYLISNRIPHNVVRGGSLFLRDNVLPFQHGRANNFLRSNYKFGPTGYTSVRAQGNVLYAQEKALYAWRDRVASGTTWVTLDECYGQFDSLSVTVASVHSDASAAPSAHAATFVVVAVAFVAIGATFVALAGAFVASAGAFVASAGASVAAAGASVAAGGAAGASVASAGASVASGGAAGASVASAGAPVASATATESVAASTEVVPSSSRGGSHFSYMRIATICILALAFIAFALEFPEKVFEMIASALVTILIKFAFPRDA